MTVAAEPRSEPAHAGRRTPAWLVAAPVALPAVVVGFLSFRSGGFFADTVGMVAVILAILVALRITVADNPFAGISGPVVVAAGALVLLAILQDRKRVV